MGPDQRRKKSTAPQLKLWERAPSLPELEPAAFGASIEVLGLKALIFSSSRSAQRGKWGRGYLPTEGDIERVRALAAGGRSLRAIEAETSIPRSTVARILKATATVPGPVGHARRRAGRVGTDDWDGAVGADGAAML